MCQGLKIWWAEFRCEDAIQNWDNKCEEVEAEIKIHGAELKCGCFINMQEFRHVCRAFKYLHEYLRGNAGKPNCKIFSWIFVASDLHFDLLNSGTVLMFHPSLNHSWYPT